MPYPKRLINEGEDVILDLKPHWWFFSKHIITGAILLVIFVLVLQFLNDITLALFGLVTLAWAVWLGLVFLDWQFTHFVVTTNRVIYRTGVLAKRGVEIPLQRINNINFRQGIWERVIGAGDLEIESAGKDGQSVFEDVRHPDAVQQEIYKQIEGDAKRQAGWHGQGHQVVSAVPSEADVAEKIRQLADLRDQGHITPEEYETKKAQLLERM